MTAVRISSVNGNSQWLDGGSMFGNVPRPVWAKWMPPDDLGRIKLVCRAMLVEVGDKKILCEAGIGAFFDAKMAQRYGVHETDHVLLKSLAELGLTHEDIDAVILSHLHFDHAGGLLPTHAEIEAGNKDLLFPNATYYVGAEAWERAKNPHPRDRASFIADLPAKLEQSGRLKVISSQDQSLYDGAISFRYSSGHTPGQMHTIVHGTDMTVLFAGDLIPGTSWVHVPVTMGYDRYPELVIDEKQKLYADFENKKLLLFYTHDPDCAASEISQEAGKVVPAHKKAALVREMV